MLTEIIVYKKNILFMHYNKGISIYLIHTIVRVRCLNVNFYNKYLKFY